MFLCLWVCLSLKEEDGSDLEPTARDKTTKRPPSSTPSSSDSVTTSPIMPETPKQLVFDGNSWIIYDMSQLPDDYLQANDEESIRLKFKTTNSDGLIWFTGNEQKNMYLALKVFSQFTNKRIYYMQEVFCHYTYFYKYYYYC